jgi:hypothetical protein
MFTTLKSSKLLWGYYEIFFLYEKMYVIIWLCKLFDGSSPSTATIFSKQDYHCSIWYNSGESLLITYLKVSVGFTEVIIESLIKRMIGDPRPAKKLNGQFSEKSGKIQV